MPVLTQFATESRATFETEFTGIKEIFDTVWIEGIIPALDLIVTIWRDIWKIIKKNWKEYGKPIFDGIREAITNTKDIILQIWEEWIKPVWDEVISAIKELWEKHLAPLLENILGLFGDITTEALIIYNKFLAPFIQKVITALARPSCGRRVSQTVGLPFQDGLARGQQRIQDRRRRVCYDNPIRQRKRRA